MSSVLTAKKILITGATSGIGRATAELIASRALAPITLLLTGRRRERLAELQADLEKNSKVQAQVFAFDISKRAEVEAFASAERGLLQDLDVLVNNAGLAAGLDDFQHGSIDDWEQMIDTNVKGLLYITRAVLPLMIARRDGHIVNIGSVAGTTTYPKGNVYCATKHAVHALTDSIRIDANGTGVRVTTIAPGMVDTEFSEVRFKGDKHRAHSVYKGMQPLTAMDIAESILWCLDRPRHVNIQEVLIMPTDQGSVRDVYRRTT